MVGFVNQLQYCDSIVWIWDMKGKRHMQGLSYPDMRPVVSFCPRGKGPEEMVGIVGFDIVDNDLFVLADRYPKLFKYDISALRENNISPSAVVSLSPTVMPAFAFVATDDHRFVLSGTGREDRIRVVDTAGRLIDHRPIAYPATKKELAAVEEEMLPYLWLSKMDCNADAIVSATQLGDVLECFAVPGRTDASGWLRIGDDGVPMVDEEGALGVVDGFSGVRIAGNKVYAVYSGFSSQEALRMLDEGENPPIGGRYFRVYDLKTGDLERVYELDRHISTFDVLPDGRTVIAADPNAEHQLCTFTLPD